MNTFAMARFRRVILNDALRVALPAVYCLAALVGVTVAIYVIRFRSANPTDDPVHVVLFGVWLIVTGMLFTGAAFRDMHHPLERYQYLMLPVSNLERLLSRYLLTGPLYVLYGVLAYLATDYLANELTHIWINERQLRFPPFSSETLQVVRGYLIAHVAVFTGAICFRSYALLKTILFLLVLVLGAAIIEELALRILFPGSYSWTQLGAVTPIPIELLPWFSAHWMNVVAVLGIGAWIIRIAYLCLRDHEADNGI